MAGLNLSNLHELSNKVCETELNEFFSLTNQVWFNFTEFNFPGLFIFINVWMIELMNGILFMHTGRITGDQTLDWLDLLKICLYLLTFLVALVGNLVVLIAVFNYRTLRGAINLYLANLAMADLFICLCCMSVHLVNHLTAPEFILGAFICKINGFVQSKCCSHFHNLYSLYIFHLLFSLYLSPFLIFFSFYIIFLLFTH